MKNKMFGTYKVKIIEFDKPIDEVVGDEKTVLKHLRRKFGWGSK